MTLDPRTKLLVVVAASVLLFAPGGAEWVPAVYLIGLVAALSARAWRRAAVFTAICGALAAGAYALPAVGSSPAVVTLAVVAGFLLRFAVLSGVVAHLLTTTGTGEFTAALRAARTPTLLLVPVTVMLRFIPIVAAETVAVADAMRLRGLSGPGAMFRHPILVAEHLVVPAIASSLRIADDLTASGLLRGLAGEARPTVYRPARLGGADLCWLTFVAVALGTVWFAMQAVA